MKITLEKTIRLLEESAGIITDKGITFPTIYDNYREFDTDYPFFLEFEFTDDDGIFKYRFFVDDNLEVELVGSSIFLIDSEGSLIEITLLENWDAENDY